MSTILQAAAERDRMEEALLDLLWPAVQRFLTAVMDSAVNGALVAAGGGDPFAWTNIQQRWRTEINHVLDMHAEREDIARIREHLETTDLPERAFQAAEEVLETSRAEEWSAYKTKLALRKALLPQQDDRESKNDFRSRVRTIARTEATRSFGSNQITRAAKDGYPGKIWVSMQDERVRDHHADTDRQERPLDEPFDVGGEALMFPGDPTGSPENTVNCRCFIVPAGPREDDLPPYDDFEDDEGAIVAAGMTTSNMVRWAGPIAMENLLTGDGRFIETDALDWGELPIPFRYVDEDNGLHDGAVSVGLIEKIERRDNGVIWGEGVIFLDDETGVKAARKIENKSLDGVSLDLDNVSFEVRVARALLESDGPEVEDTPEEDEQGRVTVVSISSDDEVTILTGANIRAATLVSIPAFADARIALVEDTAGEVDQNEDEEPIVAAAAPAPIRPPAEWFENPNLAGPTAIVVTEEGRIFGHLATWGTCHVAQLDACVTPPSSASGYAYFHVGSILTLEGTEVAVGRITMDTGHAGMSLDAQSTLAHYDHTGMVAADVRAGEDEYGIWVSGAIRPSLSEDHRRALRACPLSGDWRRVNGSLELMAALAVNVPGFPIPRPAGMVASGHQITLVAGGLVPPTRVPAPGSPNELSTEDIRWLKRLAAKESARQRARVLHQRVKMLADSVKE